MKIQFCSSLVLALALATTGVLAQSPPLADGASQIVGQLSIITNATVHVAPAHIFTIDSKTKCFDHHGAKTTCATLAGVGFAGRARVTYVGTVAQRIDILELQQ